MSEPRDPPRALAAKVTPRWWLLPRVALPALAIVMAVAAALTPQANDARSGDQRLSSYSSGPLGGRMLHELALRLGWKSMRQLRPGAPADPQAILALLDPVIPPSAERTHEILEHVRRGGALLYVATSAGPLNDSLRVRRGLGAQASVPAGVTGGITDECMERSDGAMPLWYGAEMQLWPLRWRGAPPPAIVVFAVTEEDRPSRRPAGGRAVRGGLPAAAGFALGAGRVVVIADPDLLRNDVMRVCRWGADVAYIRMLEYLGDGTRRPLVFDEFHQGHGGQPGLLGTVLGFLGRTAEGHMLTVLLLAGLLLLVARAPRIVPPRDSSRIERRSPLEHVQALARAYESVGASRTAVHRLLHGVRRRVARHGPPPMAETADAEQFLAWVEQRAPAAAPHVATVRHALAHTITANELVHVGAAVRGIEAALTMYVLPRGAPAAVQAPTSHQRTAP